MAEALEIVILILEIIVSYYFMTDEAVCRAQNGKQWRQPSSLSNRNRRTKLNVSGYLNLMSFVKFLDSYMTRKQLYDKI